MVMAHICSRVAKACNLVKCDGSVICIRTFHTVLCLGVPITLLIKPSDLQNSILGKTNIGYAIAYLSILFFSLGMYHTACLVDPGYLPIPKTNFYDDSDDDEEGAKETCDENDSESRAMLNNNSNNEPPKRICPYCNIEQPLRTRHCRDCKRCVQKYDHHCPWLETCVGEKNHKYFWLFLLTTAILIYWTFAIAWGAIEHKEKWEDWLLGNAVLIVDMFILVASGFTVTALFGFHSYLMATNSTTWESVAREKITYLQHLQEDYNPFHMGYCKNIYTFLCNFGIQKWHKLYYKRTKDMDDMDIE